MIYERNADFGPEYTKKDAAKGSGLIPHARNGVNLDKSVFLYSQF
jgi:hypothetical protein